METTRTFNIMLGTGNTNYNNKLMKRLNTIETESDSPMKLDIMICETLVDCRRTISRKAHLMLLDFKEVLIENEEEKKQVLEFCRKHQIINVKSERELFLAIGMMEKGFWDYVNPQNNQRIEE